jgi:hypothetical protein
MSRLSWLENRARRAARPGLRGTTIRTRGPAPRLEPLEDRTLLSVFTVLNNSDSGSGSLRAAIAGASSGDTIQFDSSLAGQIVGLSSGELLLDKSLSIIGLGANQLAVSANNLSRVFEVSAGMSVSIAGLTIEDGLAADGSGGGVDNGNGGSLTLTSCALSDNSGSAVFNSGGSLTVLACTFANNFGGQGGAIYNGGSASVSNSTLADNSATVGGGLYARAGSVISIENSTIAENAAAVGGGLYVDPAAYVALTSTIVANNSSYTGTPDVAGLVHSGGFNLISDTTGSSGWIGSDLQDDDPLLGPLQDNGGPTQTMALFPGSALSGLPASPALNAGALGALSPSTDQRGSARNVDGAPDIGAWEFQDLSASVVVQPVDVIYDGSAHGTTAEVFGAHGEDLGPATQMSYSSGFAPTNVLLDSDTNEVLSYTATGYFAPSNDYGEALGTASITIRQATPTVVVQPVNVAFDGQAHGSTAEAFGVSGEDLGPVDVSYSSGSAPVHAGAYTASATFAGSSDYTSATGSALIVISLANATVVVQPVHATYDGQSHGTTAEAFDDAHNNLGPASVTYSSGSAPVDAGSYTATGTFVNSDYLAIPATANITIDRAPLIVTLVPAAKVYGSANPTFVVSYQGFVGNDAPNSLEGQLTFTTSATASSGVGQYAVTPGGLTSSNYDITFVAGTLTVSAATLTVTADSVSRVFGSANPTLTYTVTGFVNNDPASVVSGTPNVSTTATPASTVGNYAITVDVGALNATNYTFAVQNGVLTITRATPVITWSDPASINSTTALSSTQLNAVADVAGSFVYNPAAGAILPVGTQTLSTLFTPADTTDYDTVTALVTIVITPASNPGAGISVSGSTLFIVGGAASSDQIQISPVGASSTGSTGLQVSATLNGVYYSSQFSQFFDTVSIVEGSGPQNIEFSTCLNLNVSITAGNGNVNIHAGSGNFTITLGNGNNNIWLGDGQNVIVAGNGNNRVKLGNGSNIVTLGDGNNKVKLGNGSNTVTLGNGNDTVNAGDGNNVITTGSGLSSVNAGNGNNLVAAGLGRNIVRVGNGRNILLDGDVTLTQAGDTLRQVLNAWVRFGSASSNVASIRSRLHVNYNTSHANILASGSGLDWFWVAYAHDCLNKKAGDLVN